MNLEKLEDQAKAFAQVVKGKNCHIHTELGVIETSYLRLKFDLVAVANKTMELLKKQGFEFKSPRGREFLLALKERFMSPKNYGWEKSEVEGLAKVFEVTLRLSIYTLESI